MCTKKSRSKEKSTNRSDRHCVCVCGDRMSPQQDISGAKFNLCKRKYWMPLFLVSLSALQILIENKSLRSFMDAAKPYEENGSLEEIFPAVDIRPQTSALTKCWLEIEENFKSLFYEWNQHCQPILHSVKIIGEVFYVLISIQDLLKPTQNRWLDGKYACNGISKGIELTRYKTEMILKCPRSINASTTVLRSVSVEVPGSTARCNAVNGKLLKKKAKQDFVVVSYNTTLFDECEREDIRHHEGRFIGGVSYKNFAPKKAVHAVFSGDRRKAFEWASYHHMIGFDHVWIYVNEDWDDGKGLIHRDYITWIPFYFRNQEGKWYRRETRADNPMETFRIAGQNDGLWRSKRMGMDWFAGMDVDEYIALGNPKSKNAFHSSLEVFGKGLSASDIDTLPKYLETFQTQIGNNFTGIQMKSVFFGSGPEKTRRNTTLVIDYDWRQKGNAANLSFTRAKLLLNVTCNNYVELHVSSSNASCSADKLWKSNGIDLWFNHYKKPDKGVFGGGKNHQHHTKYNLERDTYLKDKYREKLLLEIHSNLTVGE